MRYRVETLVLLVLVPFAVLALIAMVAVPVCQRLHPRHLERLHEFDTEQGAIDGLITSNVGDSTLAVHTIILIIIIATTSCFIYKSWQRQPQRCLMYENMLMTQMYLFVRYEHQSPNISCSFNSYIFFFRLHRTYWITPAHQAAAQVCHSWCRGQLRARSAWWSALVSVFLRERHTFSSCLKHYTNAQCA